MIRSVPVDLGERAYDVLIGPGLVDEAGVRLRPFVRRDRVAVVSDETVWSLHGTRLTAALKRAGLEAYPIVLPPGEQTKSFAGLEGLCDALLALELDRGDLIVAFGGGVIGDLAGFAAAVYKRGADFVQIPTTLLAQVDSSVGGKTAINHALGKNMIGAFYQPQRVVCDLDVLRSLPQRELSAGLAEVIKYGPIADMALLDWLEVNLNQLLAREPQALGDAVRRSCEIKAGVVGLDEREAGLRAILNFGHTFGHAIEAGLGYGQWLHGEAVGCGMVMAALLSHRLGLIDAELVHRLRRLVQAAGLPVVGPRLDAHDNAGRYLALMRLDKKAEAGEIKFVVIEAPGRASVRGAPDALVREVIDACCLPH